MTGLDGKVAFLTSHFGICIMSFICTHFQLTKTHWCILLWNNWIMEFVRRFNDWKLESVKLYLYINILYSNIQGGGA